MTLLAALALIAFAYLLGLTIGRHQNDMLHAKVVAILAREDDKILVLYNNTLLRLLHDKRKK